MRYVIFGTLALAACVEATPVTTTPSTVSDIEKQAIQQSINTTLKDPYSARYENWRGFEISNGDRAICGTVNSKNSFGAYAGADPFYIRMRGEQSVEIQVGQLAQMACQAAGQNNLSIRS